MKSIKIGYGCNHWHRWLSVLSFIFLTACGGSSPKQAGPTDTGAATADITVTATADISALVNKSVGSNTPVTVTFGTTDGQPAKSLTVTTGLSPLPDGWSTATANFTCPSVSASNPCQLTLNYAPTVSTTSRVLTLGFTYVDNAGAQRTGTVDLTYSAIVANTVSAAVTPVGPIQNTVGATSVVSVSFAASDGTPATNLDVTGGLAGLPPGWSVNRSSLPCASVSANAPCQLSLAYTPTAVTASSTLTFGYSYTDSTGTARTGLVEIPYAAAAASTIVTTQSPTGPLGVFVGSNASVTLNFASNDGNTDSNLRLTSSLPAGWAVTGSSLPCAAVSLGNTCVLTLTYTPTVATPSSSLLLGYAYTDNAGQPRTGSQAITYSAVSHLAFITNVDSNTVTQCALGVAGKLVNCSAQTSAQFVSPFAISADGGAVYVTEGSGTVTRCNVDSSGLSQCSVAGNGFSSPVSLIVNGSVAYESDQGTGLIFRCSIDPAGDLTGCVGLALPSPLGGVLAINGSTLYMTVASLPNLVRCSIGAAGALSGCVNDTLPFSGGGIAMDASSAYVTATTNAVFRCLIDNTTGMLTGCADSGAGTTVFNQPNGITIFGGFAYVVNRGNNTVTQCRIGSDGGLSNCIDSGASGLDSPVSMAIQ